MSSLFGALRASSLRTALKSPVLVVPIPLHRPLSTLNFYRNQRPQLDRRWRSHRWKSGIAASDTSPITLDLPGGKEVVSGTETLPDTGFVADAVNSIPPLQYGDFQVLGLGGWSPAGIIQSSFEIIHVWSGLPWFHTFIAATLFWRFLIFPFAVIGMRNSARMRPVAPRLTEASKAINDARLMGDTVAMQKASMEASKIRREAGVSMLGLVAPLIQLPISIGLFFGVRRMCELPLMQLTQSGFEWLPDLTQPGPYYILPILVAASGNLMITMSARDMDTSRPAMGHFMNVIRVATVLGIYWMDQFASGLLLCLFVTSTSAVAQSALFRSSMARSLLRIPQWTPPPS
ncbi:60Kd inner membrane protein-domain-containing protein, partial [Favolaschia claudopus]